MPETSASQGSEPKKSCIPNSTLQIGTPIVQVLEKWTELGILNIQDLEFFRQKLLDGELVIPFSELRPKYELKTESYKKAFQVLIQTQSNIDRIELLERTNKLINLQKGQLHLREDLVVRSKKVPFSFIPVRREFVDLKLHVRRYDVPGWEPYKPIFASIGSSKYSQHTHAPNLANGSKGQLSSPFQNHLATNTRRLSQQPSTHPVSNLPYHLRPSQPSSPFKNQLPAITQAAISQAVSAAAVSNSSVTGSSSRTPFNLAKYPNEDIYPPDFSMRHETNPLPIKLSNAFEVSRSPVTIGKWLEVMGSIPESLKNKSLDLPMGPVTWWSILVFLNKLSILDRYRPAYYLDDITWNDLNYTTAAAEGRLAPLADTTYGKIVKQSFANISFAEGYRLPTEVEMWGIFEEVSEHIKLRFSEEKSIDIEIFELFLKDIFGSYKDRLNSEMPLEQQLSLPVHSQWIDDLSLLNFRIPTHDSQFIANEINYTLAPGFYAISKNFRVVDPSSTASQYISDIKTFQGLNGLSIVDKLTFDFNPKIGPHSFLMSTACPANEVVHWQIRPVRTLH